MSDLATDMDADIAELRAEVAALRRLVWLAYYEPLPAGEGPELYPCLLCGYNGPGFYDPANHPCAALAPAKEQP